MNCSKIKLLKIELIKKLKRCSKIYTLPLKLNLNAKYIRNIEQH